MREGDQNRPSYLTSVHRHRCVLSVPGGPTICFKCEGVGHLRHVQRTVVSKRGEGPVGKAPFQAVSKPTVEEPSGSPSNQEGLVAIPTSPPQGNQEDHGSPYVNLSPSFVLQHPICFTSVIGREPVLSM